jgi:hypothetical protein
MHVNFRYSRRFPHPAGRGCARLGKLCIAFAAIPAFSRKSSLVRLLTHSRGGHAMHAENPLAATRTPRSYAKIAIGRMKNAE